MCFLFFHCKISCKCETNFVCINNTKNEYKVNHDLFYLSDEKLKCDRKGITNCYETVEALIKKYNKAISMNNSDLERYSTGTSSLREFS